MKLYANEFGAAVVRALPNVVVSRLARVEVPAALWRKERAGELSVGAAMTLVVRFEADFLGHPTSRFAVVADTDEVLERAASLAGAHGLRAYDAVQLATAVAVRAADPSCDAFACFDRDLRRAAALNGFALVPA